MNIYQRINKVRDAIPYLKKDTKVQGYTAVTHDAVTALVRPKFIEHGIVVVPRVIKSNTVQDTGMATSGGTPVIRYEGRFAIDFVNIDDPSDKITVRVDAHANDHGDKAPGKATSYATKYAMLKLLSIETGDGEESRSDYASPQIVELNEILAAEDAESLFALRYSMPIEKWNRITGIARQSAEKKRDWDNTVKRLLQQHEATLVDTAQEISRLIHQDDDMGTMQLWDELTKPEKAYVWENVNPDEQAAIKRWNRSKAA